MPAPALQMIGYRGSQGQLSRAAQMVQHEQRRPPQEWHHHGPCGLDKSLQLLHGRRGNPGCSSVRREAPDRTLPGALLEHFRGEWIPAPMKKIRQRIRGIEHGRGISHPRNRRRRRDGAASNRPRPAHSGLAALPPAASFPGAGTMIRTRCPWPCARPRASAPTPSAAAARSARYDEPGRCRLRPRVGHRPAAAAAQR